MAMKTSIKRSVFRMVNAAHKNYDDVGRKAQELWEQRMHEHFEKGQLDLAYEYVSMLELLCFKSLSKSDPFRLKMWRMFVTDFRRAFSDHEQANFQWLKEFDNT